VGAVLAALNNIAVDAKALCISMKWRIDVLLIVMARYPESNSVQTQGCLLLKNYTYEHASFQAMKNRADDLRFLIYLGRAILKNAVTEHTTLKLPREIMIDSNVTNENSTRLGCCLKYRLIRSAFTRWRIGIVPSTEASGWIPNRKKSSGDKSNVVS
jgi:hypothetical protein